MARKILLSLLGLGIICSIIGQTMQGTRSAFTATTINPSNTFAAGTLEMTNGNDLSACTKVVASGCGAFTFGGLGAAMAIGTQYQSSVTIKNAGSLPASMTIKLHTDVGDKVTGGDGLTLDQHLNVTVEDTSIGGHYCVYTTTGPPAAGTCTTLTGLAGVTSPLPAVGSYTSAVTLPNLASAASQWPAGESHSYTITIEVDQGSLGAFTCPGATSALSTDCKAPQDSHVMFDVVWTAQQ